MHWNVATGSIHIPYLTGEPLRTRYSIRHISVLGGDRQRPRVSLSIIRADIIHKVPIVLVIGIHLQIDPFDKVFLRQHLMIRSNTLIISIRLEIDETLDFPLDQGLLGLPRNHNGAARIHIRVMSKPDEVMSENR